MSNGTKPQFQGACIAPFLQEDLFPSEGGFVQGRYCSPALGPSCCLPCPAADWLYPDSFNTVTQVANWINVVSLVAVAFLLASFAFLPVEKTHRHYLSICLAMAVILMNLGFIVPLGANPEQCFNEITPHDMTSNLSCAFSGAFLIAGGWGGVMWVFLRAVALHLQICWQMVIGKRFMWGALATGWGIPAIGLTVALVFSGVSFRFGDTCHVNHQNSLADLWIPLLAFAGITVIIQFGTFGYCIKVYLQSLADDSTTTDTSGLPSYSTSVRGTISPKQAYRRVRRVIELQWRGIAIVLLIIADVIFFAIVFVFADGTETKIIKNPQTALPWLTCIVQKGDKNQCLSLTDNIIVNEATIIAVLLLLSLNGIWCLFLLGRISMFTGWLELLRPQPDVEFVSVDVRQFKNTPDSYEMLSKDRDMSKDAELDQQPYHKAYSSPAPSNVVSPISPVSPAVTKSGRETPDYFGREARYKSPSRSFSSPVPPLGVARSQTESWDSTSTHAPPMSSTGVDTMNMNKL
ncbi:hypothetical protein HYFRA_00009169 [Hymenoscyphus fraxineus]|uniref:G-protein coupled receptors family 2 profile 2 domain-containing protein n=1 Tax=Hymenoscyphus fraxineus TaxID=746836 RepID=A0A9N9PT28_9HELO|nr:hypothetical protein HYFRA_00009169 [Hymenoscyphus fraxineus]